MWDKIFVALGIVGLKTPNTLFIAAEGSRYYLHFANIDPGLFFLHKDQLAELGFDYSVKYETLRVDSEILWDNHHEPVVYNLLDRFDNGLERFQTSALFNQVVKQIMIGGDIFQLIDQLVQMIDNKTQ